MVKHQHVTVPYIKKMIGWTITFMVAMFAFAISIPGFPAIWQNPWVRQHVPWGIGLGILAFEALITVVSIIMTAWHCPISFSEPWCTKDHDKVT